MIENGSFVALRGGNTRYKAICTQEGWLGNYYTLISTVSGRKKYRVAERYLTPWDQRVRAVKTTRGKVARPKQWDRLQAFSGSTRRTFIGEKWVFKVGTRTWGDVCNKREAALYALQSGVPEADVVEKFGAAIVDGIKRYQIRKVPVAECYLLEDGTLMMERVMPISSLQAREGAPSMDGDERVRRGLNWGGKNVPDWLSYIDSAQAGVNRKGELVAYDL